MNPQPEMKEKWRARMQRGAAPFLDPDETVIYGVSNLGLPAWVYGAFVGLPLLPYVIQKACVALITDRRVLVLKTTGFNFRATRVLLKAPLGSLQTRIGGSAFPGRFLLVGDQKLWLAANRNVHDCARAIVAAASSQRGSLTIQTSNTGWSPSTP